MDGGTRVRELPGREERPEPMYQVVSPPLDVGTWFVANQEGTPPSSNRLECCAEAVETTRQQANQVGITHILAWVHVQRDVPKVGAGGFELEAPAVSRQVVQGVSQRV